ncbi:sensor histidine kinase [Muricauda sp. SCSIO 64092]|uniref:sensor histidine kinase n=1 Tax=Allomuricauda sp. SCSIO 64092 TaxID=2908842 RepID=UPI001FF3DE77|nr:sensor histidine kinase [Muricauda sp. SCSIO 64092]UOY05963.1 sensor histidine kinase [Muricauda sp. SCSIO 64092]
MRDRSTDRKASKKNQFIEILNYFASAISFALLAYCWTKELHILVLLVLLLMAILFLGNGLHIRKNSGYRQTHSGLEAKLREKETLLKEVHHRVKNNLQTVSSLLSLQSRAVADPKIEGIIKSSQHRVVSMSMVHEMLYKRDDYTSKIELKPYVEELCEYLVRSVKGNENKVTTDFDIGDYRLSIDTVIPLGLIINETITNALKYGIPNNTEGEIKIHLSKKGTNSFEMYLGDNGIGFPDDVNPKTTKSLGLKLIHNLARQLKGSIVRDNETKGTYYQINFEEVVEEFNSVD